MNKVYTNVDPVLRHAVDQIPAGDWLQDKHRLNNLQNGTKKILRSVLRNQLPPESGIALPFANILIAAAWSRAYNRFNAPFMFSYVRCLCRSLRALYEGEFVVGNADERSQGTKQQAF
jgi:hypothetical protein